MDSQSVDWSELTDDALTRDFRVFQRRKGHRFSLDDLLTAWVAGTRLPTARRILDLGSGIGSVALVLAWALPESTLTTIEAHFPSFLIQKLNIERNRLAHRIQPVCADLRDRNLLRSLGNAYELITCTPPYYPPSACLHSPDPQRAHARVELRGGIEAYLEAASLMLAPKGIVVISAHATQRQRLLQSAKPLDLWPEDELVVIPREGKAPLFSVWTLSRVSSEAHSRSIFVARSSSGERSEDYVKLMAWLGLHPGALPRGRAR
ncbi:MAG: methyltransferase [Deltaproteobacteria bacterium]|nr:methyltransferase [Deltaproteobacteria bacterium]